MTVTSPMVALARPLRSGARERPCIWPDVQWVERILPSEAGASRLKVEPVTGSHVLDEISSLTISDPPTQAEVQALRQKSGSWRGMWGRRWKGSAMRSSKVSWRELTFAATEWVAAGVSRRSDGFLSEFSNPRPRLARPWCAFFLPKPAAMDHIPAGYEHAGHPD